MFASKAVRITEKIVKKIRNRVPADITVVAFTTETDQPYLDERRRVFSANDIIFTDSITRAIEDAEKEGVVTRSGDRVHWNNQGHLIVGQQLAELLKDIIAQQKRQKGTTTVN